MRLILFDCPSEKRVGFHPFGLEPADLRASHGHRLAGRQIGCQHRCVGRGVFCAAVPGRRLSSCHPRPVNDPATLMGDDLLFVDGRVKRGSFRSPSCRQSVQVVSPPTARGKWPAFGSRMAIWASSRPIRSTPCSNRPGRSCRRPTCPCPCGNTFGNWSWRTRRNWRPILPRWAAAESRAASRNQRRSAATRGTFTSRRARWSIRWCPRRPAGTDLSRSRG